MTVRVVLADDQALVRSGFRVLLETTDDLDVVGEATNGAEAVDLAVTKKPDVVLMDIRMPVMDGLEATRRIGSTPGLERVRVLILTTFEVDSYVFEALRAGAAGFLLKDAETDELLRVIRVVADGDALLAPSITRTLIEEYVARPAPSEEHRLAVLTDREREVMALVAAGSSNEEIATRSFMSPATAKTHVSRAMTKLHVRGRAQLVVLAYETGLVTPGHVGHEV